MRKRACPIMLVKSYSAELMRRTPLSWRVSCAATLPGTANNTRCSAATAIPTCWPSGWSLWLGKIASSWLPVGSCRRYKVEAPRKLLPIICARNVLSGAWMMSSGRSNTSTELPGAMV
ncbi:hypothetical protein WR25_14777 [Diploscapter pachys]|uniref:Uncharacterized protein n=1 Tax=Diploscapter pachys TaxID=2018661 RepID=A0A2A2M2N1_9BILA|nr:hypothetical protein WR25_14777 [Diploscapter pachys]